MAMPTIKVQTTDGELSVDLADIGRLTYSVGGKEWTVEQPRQAKHEKQKRLFE